MKKLYALFLSIILCSLYSCRHKEYDLSNGINTEMNFGGDSLFLPIGSTDSIFLSQFLGKLDIDLLTVLENAGYALRLRDSAIVDVPTINPEQLRLDDIVVEQKQNISLSKIDFDNLYIEGITVEENMNLGLPAISLDGVVIPKVEKTGKFIAEMSKYKMSNLELTDINFGVEKQNLFKGEVAVPSSSGMSEEQLESTLLSFPDVSTSNENIQNDLKLSVDVPKGVKQIDTIYLKAGAKMVISIKLDSMDFLQSGEILPTINIDPSNLFIFDNLPEEGLSFNTSNPLNGSNRYSISKEFPIKALMVGKEDGSPIDPINGNIAIDKKINTVFSLELKGAKAYAKDVEKINTVDWVMSLDIVDIDIDYLKFDIPEIVVDIAQDGDFELAVDIPEQVSKVDSILLTPESKFAMSFSKNNFENLQGVNIIFQKMTIEFPPQFNIFPQQNLVSNVYTLENFDFTESTKKLNFKVINFNLTNSAIINGKLKVQEKVKVVGKYLITGRVSSANIPTSPAMDPGIAFKLESDLGFVSADLVLAKVNEHIPTAKIPIDINIDIDPSIKELKEIKVKNASMLIQIGMPILPSPLNVKANNIQIKFPKLFKFKETPSGFNQATNTYTINGDIPSIIDLKIDRLVVNSVLVNGVLKIMDSVMVTGGVEIPSCSINSSKLSGLEGKEFNLKTEISRIQIEEIGLDGIGVDLSDSTKIEMEIADFPKEVYSLDSILLNGAVMDIKLQLNNMPDFGGKPLNANIIIDLPDFIKFGAGQIEAGNILKIQEDLTNNRWSKHLDILALTFDGKPLNGEFKINELITFKGRVEIVDPTINVEDLAGREIEVLIEAKITNLAFSKVYGRVKPDLEPQFMSIALSDLPDFLKSDSIVLDIDNPYIDMIARANIGIPLSANIQLNPWANGTINEAGSIDVSVDFPCSNNPAIDAVSKYWIAKNQSGKPNDYVFKPAQISNIIKKLPDSIQLKVNIETDLTKQHIVDLNAAYKAKILYDFVIPLAFGRDFQFSMTDTMRGMDSKLMEMIFKGNSLGLVGEIMNTIPLDLEMKIYPIDSLNRIIPITPPTQKIESGKFNGDATTTKLDITFSDPSKLMVNVSGFIISFSAKCGKDAAGVPIKPSNFVKVQLKAKIFGGFTYKP